MELRKNNQTNNQKQHQFAIANPPEFIFKNKFYQNPVNPLINAKNKLSSYYTWAEKIDLRIPAEIWEEWEKIPNCLFRHINKDGCYLWYRDIIRKKPMKYPAKGFPFMDGVDQLNIIKKALKGMLGIVTEKPIRYFLPLLFLFPRKTLKRLFWVIASNFIHLVSYVITWMEFDEHYMCRASREFYRVGIEIIGGVSEEDLKQRNDKWLKHECLMTFCTMLEMDNAYRYRFQDFFGELNKELFNKNPAQEIKRVFMLGADRDNEGVRPKWQKTGKMFYYLIRFNKDFRNLIIDVVSRLNLEEVALDEEDKYHCLVRSDYQFMGVPIENRLKLRKVIDDEEKIFTHQQLHQLYQATL